MPGNKSNYTEALEKTQGGGGSVRTGRTLMDAATKTVVTGLTSVTKVIASLDDDPVAGCQFVTATIGNQSGAPAAGSVILKIWKATAAGDTTLIAGTTLTKYVNWVAYGVA